MAQGESVALLIPVVNNDGQPVTLTGASAVFVIAPTLGATALVTVTTASGGITISTTNAPSDTLRVALAPADTADLAGRYVWEAALTGASAGRVAWGEIEIAPSTPL